MPRILIIDDDLVTRKLLRVALGYKNYEVITAENCKQGLEMLHHTPSDVVIVDMIMPEKNGLKTIMDLTREFPNVKIIAISGDGSIEAERYLNLAEDLGARRSYTKPLNLKELSQGVQELLEQ